MSEPQPTAAAPITPMDILLFLLALMCGGIALDKSDFAGSSAAAGGAYVATAIALGCLSISRAIRHGKRP